MNHARVTERGLIMQSALRKMIADTSHSHWVTLNFHADYPMKQAEKRLRMWSLDVISRLFHSKKFSDVPIERLFHFTAFPEYTKTGHLHYHLPTWIHENRRDWFSKVAAPLWKKTLPTGTADIQQIGQEIDDLNRIATYTTKHASRPFSYENFITSNMLELPTTEGAKSHASYSNNNKNPLSTAASNDNHNACRP